MTGNIILLIIPLLPMIGACVGYIIGKIHKSARSYFADVLCIVEFGIMVYVLSNVALGRVFTLDVPFMLGGLHFKADGFRAMYGTITAFMWMCTTVFAKEYFHHYRNRNRYYFFALLTFGGTIGVFMADEIITMFIFFEIMSVASYVMVVHDEAPYTMRAGQTYMAVAILGGMVMLMGIFLLKDLVGTLMISELHDACAAVPADKRARLYVAGGLMLFGFGAKAGMYPLHIWLPKAHPVAPASASALLSGILTKAGVFGVLILSCQMFLHDAAWGTMLLVFGVLTMVTGAVIAVFSINLKRTLACSSVSQIGFILVGIAMQCLLGEENALAVWGTELHMVNHSLIKLALFMSSGVVYMTVHMLDLNDIRGFGHGKPFLMVVFIAGYLGISGVPMFNGYISKTLIHEGIVEYIEILHHHGHSIIGMKIVEWLFLFSGGLTFAYMTKLFVAVFLEKNNSPKMQAWFDSMNRGTANTHSSAYSSRMIEGDDSTIRSYINIQSKLALGAAAIVLPIIGYFPDVFMKRMAELGQGFMHGESPEHAIHWFSQENLNGALISLGIGAIVYFFFIRKVLYRPDEERPYVNLWPEKLDIEDAIYRPLAALVAKLCVLVSTVFASLPDMLIRLVNGTLLKTIAIPEENHRDHEPGELGFEKPLPKSFTDITGGFTFGLILFGLGLCLMLVVMLLR